MLTTEPAVAPITVDSPDTSSPHDSPASIASAATIMSVGNLSSRVVGLFREIAKSFFFGNGRMASAFELASSPPSQFYDMLIGGMLSSALVPTFSGLVTDERDENSIVDFGKLLGALIGLATVGLTVLVLALWALTEAFAHILAGGPNQDVQLVASLLRITIPTIIFLNLSGILTAALYARRRFAYTAFTATAYNLSIIACVALFEGSLSVSSLAVGMLLGSVLQVAMQIPGLRGIPIRISLNYRHPGITQIVKLFLPVAGGLALAQLAALFSAIIAGQIGTAGPATMRYAAQVIQFPLGMIVVAVSSAILPSLSRHNESISLDNFKSTLTQGMRLVWVLILPASVGLFVLAQPVIAILFQRGAFTIESTAYTAMALRAAVPGLVFAAIDQPLIFAFYARRDTRTPTLIGFVSTLSYLAIVGVLAVLSQNNLRLFTLTDLILANSLKTGLDALLMAIFLTRKIGGLHHYQLWSLALKVLLASCLMGAAVYAATSIIQARVGAESFIANAIAAVGGAVVGLVIYVTAALLLQIREIRSLRSLIKR